MKIVFFSSNIDTIDNFSHKHQLDLFVSYSDIESLNEFLTQETHFILVVDYDSVSQELNKLISSGVKIEKTITLESVPAVATGKMLISHGIKAYGNLQISTTNLRQMIDTVKENNIWTYPELTIALSLSVKEPKISQDSIELIETRLSQKESEVIYLILDGFNNDAIASKLEITTRTVKAHVSSIFSKLHVNDRISLVLLLR